MARPRTTSDEAILAAAGRAIGRHGPAGVTLAAVAEQAGLSPATLVQRFGSKRGLLLAVAEQAARVAGVPFGAARREHDSPLAALYAALSGLAADVRTPEEMANSLGFLQLDLTDSDFRAHAVAHTRETRREIAGLLADAVAAGELAPGENVEELARAVHVTYNGTLILWAMTADGSLVDALRSDLDRLLRPYRA
ncbi:TetR/AcrR family transcriptional regulator [Planobispora takensis]|uniref:TetR family transcriptional regulator n=1 Tax=Planobispora takensis TaxID=1367882 RepID=A0A8J3STM5_9ACTN|nr:TetR/AcrR family transcriptional regulator [Planobispora takensis]GIH98169.1 TetR family transcriptional regulator [Planobispora takensis]